MRKPTQLMVAGMSAIAVGYGFARYGFGLFVPVFREAFGLSTRDIGLISAAGYASYVLAVILAGVVCSRSGPRLPVVTGALCASLGMLLIATAQNATMLTAGVMLAGMSPGFCWAPYSDAVAMMVDPEHRSRVLAVVSTGTAVGLTVAGPVALVTATEGNPSGSAWRYGWMAFAAAAAMVAVWNARLLPATPHGEPDPDISGAPRGINVRWFVCPQSAPLLAQAFCYGLVAAFYYTYAVDLVTGAGHGMHWGAVLWSLVGLAGLTGVLSGDAARRFGLHTCLAVSFGVMAASIAVLPLGSTSTVVVVIGAGAFGAAYMPAAALHALWSSQVYHERPAAGYSAVLFSLALGSIIGPAALGSVADAVGLAPVFWGVAALTALIPALRPRADRGSTASQPAPDGASHLPDRTAKTKAQSLDSPG